MFTILGMFEYIHAMNKNETEILKPKLTRFDVD